MVKNGCDQSGLCWYNFTEIKKWLKIFGASMVKNRCDQSDDGTLKFTVS